MSSKIKEAYKVKVDDVELDIRIIEEDNELKYMLLYPVFEAATLAFLKKIRDKLVMETEISTTEIASATATNTLREKFRDRIEEWLAIELPELDEDAKKNMIVMLLNNVLGLGDIEYLMRDNNLEEIVINSSKEPVRVYHRKYGWLSTNIMIPEESTIENYSRLIARGVGKDISLAAPLLDAYLHTKDRVNAVLSPISDKGNAMTIRMFPRDPWTITDFLENKTVTNEVLALIWLAIQYESNIIFSGGTGSGKTSFLNVCMPFIQPNHRIVSIEDTRELQLPTFLHWCPLKTRMASSEGEGEISMLDLLVNSLRMRPDRIIFGEIRKEEEARILFEAMHTGHSVYSTLHADTCSQTVRRLSNPPISIPAILLESINLVVVMFRDRRRGIRRVYQIGEIIPSEDIGGSAVVKTNVIYRWKPKEDKIVKNRPEIRFFDDLSKNTGLSKREILQDIENKKKILSWLVRYKICKVDDIGKVMRKYYLDEDNLIKLVERNTSPEKIFGG